MGHLGVAPSGSKNQFPRAPTGAQESDRLRDPRHRRGGQARRPDRRALERGRRWSSTTRRRRFSGAPPPRSWRTSWARTAVFVVWPTTGATWGSSPPTVCMPKCDGRWAAPPSSPDVGAAVRLRLASSRPSSTSIPVSTHRAGSRPGRSRTSWPWRRRPNASATTGWRVRNTSPFPCRRPMCAGRGTGIPSRRSASSPPRLHGCRCSVMWWCSAITTRWSW